MNSRLPNFQNWSRKWIAVLSKFENRWRKWIAVLPNSKNRWRKWIAVLSKFVKNRDFQAKMASLAKFWNIRKWLFSIFYPTIRIFDFLIVNFLLEIRLELVQNSLDLAYFYRSNLLLLFINSWFFFYFGTHLKVSYLCSSPAFALYFWSHLSLRIAFWLVLSALCLVTLVG